MNKTKVKILTGVAAGFLAGIVLLGAGVSSMKYLPFNWSNSGASDHAFKGIGYAPHIPIEMTFAGEDVPLKDREVRERLDRELIINVYRHSSTLILMKKAQQWLPLVERVLIEEGVPSDFKYLCIAESDLSFVVSPSGAAGFWQFMKPTAEGYGMEVSDDVDQRYDVEISTRAACKYLKDAYAKFGNWTMAAASYNMGMSGLSKSSEKQGATNYYDLLLNTETSRYILRIAAIKLVIENPEAYGFNLNKEDKYEPYKYEIHSVNGDVDSWVDFAKSKGISYKTLRLHNMWIRDVALKNELKKTYNVKIPTS